MNTLAKNVRYSILGYAIFLLSQTGIILTISRSQSLEDAGRYGFSLALLSILFVSTNLGLRTSYATDLASEKSYATYMKTRRFTSGIALIAGIVTTGILYVYDARTSALFFIILFSKFFESLSDMAYGCFQRHHRMDLVSKSLLFRGIMAFIAFSAATYLTGSLIISVASQSITWAATAIFHDYKVSKSLPDKNGDKEQPSIKRILSENLPLGVGNIFTEITISSPRIIVTSLLGLSQGGIYSAIGYSLVLGSAFAASISHAMATKLAEAISTSDRRKFLDLLLPFVISLFFVGLATFLITSTNPEFFIALAFGDKYAGNGNILQLFCLVLTVRMPIAALQTGLIAQRQIVTNAKIRFLTCILTVSLTVYAATYERLEVVALCVLITSLCQLALLIAAINQCLPKSSNT